jgi:hypothetical protein
MSITLIGQLWMLEIKHFFTDKPDKEDNQNQSSATEHTSGRTGKYWIHFHTKCSILYDLCISLIHLQSNLEPELFCKNQSKWFESLT